MGIFLNPGAESFEKALCSDIYVDKSKMLSFLNSVLGTNQNNICVSRPRRFGKTMAANMISAYYDRSISSRDLFSGLALAQTKEWDQYLNQFDVLRLNMIDFTSGSLSAGAMLERTGMTDISFMEQSRMISKKPMIWENSVRAPFLSIAHCLS